ncbi:uncharacterized protein N7483_010080 [Penicillium malachiteum]|uniref:uncharacterized protein n=1 Tax=Penicillium malachiteum TaxID=1324776 RepID=UPI002546815A|nr:uncharacterized protein N7483_010080 [Penicillium malachiteum]KAJ5712899.1 hypothetical protein N7483_010080 [Penicillium malachiteum]
MTTNTSPGITTRFLVFSDTHGLDSLPDSVSSEYADVAIHCGDLTTESKLDEYKASIRFLQAVNAPLKRSPELVDQVYGRYGEVRRILNEATGITVLDEGTYSFRLQNGASLTVYASPYTPSFGDWGFQYRPDHGFDIQNVDLVITHGPPKGIMDYTYSGERAGCPYLFEAIARARPRMHCFGHIHHGWGAKLVTWRRNVSQKPSHLTDIDNGSSVLIDKLATLTPKGLSTTSHCSGDPDPLIYGSHTLFVNAAIEGTADLPVQPLWLVDLELQPALT